MLCNYRIVIEPFTVIAGLTRNLPNVRCCLYVREMADVPPP